MNWYNLPAFCFILLMLGSSCSTLVGQSAFTAFQEAEELYEQDKKNEAFDLLHKAQASINEFPEQMSLAQAEKFYDLYASLTYGLKKMDLIDSVYLAGISYGDFIQNDTLACKFINLRGNLWRIKNQWNKAITILKSGIDRQCYTSDYIQIHALLGKCYTQINFDSIQYYVMKVLPLAEQQQDTLNLMLLYNNLVSYYRRSNRKAQAFEYEKKSLDYEGQFPIMQIGSNLSIASLLTSMNHLSLAEEYLQNADSLISDRNDRRTLAQVSYHRARLEFVRKNYDKALERIQYCLDYFIEKSYTNQTAAALSDKAKFAREKGDQELYHTTIAQLEGMLDDVNSVTFKYAASSQVAKYYLELGNPTRAKQIMSGLDISLDEIDWVDRDHYLEIKAKIAEQEHNYQQSIGYYEQLNTYRDSMEKANVINQVFLSEQQYDRNKKNAAINQLTVEAEVAKNNLKTSKQIIAMSLISLSFLLYFIFALYKKNKKITEQQESLNSALKDKDILLREIHHRVKNNLQVVSSLLNLQSNYIHDNAALEAINEGKNRVSSMALIHQNLYQEENLTGINCKEYFEDLIDNLFDSYNISERSIQLEKKVSNLNLDVETMVPLGLIVNELISNALKHAFTEKDGQGNIYFTLKEEKDTLLLSIEDDGKGLDSNQFLNSKSFGNKLIQAFQQKLGAEISIEDKNGTHITLIIHKYKKAA